MKTEKKASSSGIKQKMREEREKGKHMGTAIMAAILIVVIVVAVFLVNFMLSLPSNPVNPTSKPKAVIVDHLNQTEPNPVFVENATKILEQAGYSVDYIPAETVKVDFYSNLATHDYRIVVLRVHSAGSSATGTLELSLFTSEPYDRWRYQYEQLTDQVTAVSFTPSGQLFYGISPIFVTSSMKSRFNKTIIVMMGCEGLNGTQMARAFIDKGAQAYIGWTGPVSASHTDDGTICLLQKLALANQTVAKAVENTMSEVGPDPVYQCVLDYYPH